MTDLFDRASEIEQQQRDLALQNRLQHQQAAQPTAVRFCQDCEDELPEFRQKLGCTRCVTCQTIHEQKQKGYRKW